jgi:hypothetical protein
MADEQGQRIPAGGVTFHVEYRVFGGDRGPAIRVLGDVDGRQVQLLRFDCFEKDPHYHFDPDGKDFHLNLSRETVPDPLAWALGELKRNLPVMIRAAGYPGVAERLDRKAATAAVEQVAAAVREESARHG